LTQIDCELSVGNATVMYGNNGTTLRNLKFIQIMHVCMYILVYTSCVYLKSGLLGHNRPFHRQLVLLQKGNYILARCRGT
jgi:hypothetical protein